MLSPALVLAPLCLLTYLTVVLLASLLSFLLYGWDKRQARHGGRRIPEKTLHLAALLGGWPGAWAGQQVFRHKTQKVSFRIVFWLIVFLNAVVLAALVWWNIRA
jgi:uncharacterized membrane protein YsdA (DUF1294 family)